jgi:low temperature requirement protein LtrA
VSSGSARPAAPGLEPAAPGARATWLELFFDLVFVYAFLNVALTTSAGLTPTSLLRGLLILAPLWFAWTTFAALGNTVRADQGIMPLVGFASTAVIFVAALSIPHTLTQDPRDRDADLVFATCYLLVRALQVFAIWYSARHDPQLRLPWLALAVPAALSSALLLAAALVPPFLFGRNRELAFTVEVVLWVLAIAVAYGVSAVVKTRSLPLVSARHWAERYGQVVLIALGESFISLGTGPRLQAGLPLTWPVIYGSAVGIVVIAALAWAYFDIRQLVGVGALERARGPAKNALARDAYAYLHLPMIVGVILFSLGLKKVLSSVADLDTPNSRPLPDIDIYLLYGGVCVYLGALLAFQLRTGARTDWFQLAARLGLLALIPPALVLPGIAALGLLAAFLLFTTSVNHVRWAGQRRQLRGGVLAEERAVEAAETWWRHGEEAPPSRAELRERARPRRSR